MRIRDKREFLEKNKKTIDNSLEVYFPQVSKQKLFWISSTAQISFKQHQHWTKKMPQIMFL